MKETNAEMRKNKTYKGMIWPVDHDRKLKYMRDLKIPRFDFHPDYPEKDHEVFIKVNAQTGNPLKDNKPYFFQQIRFGRLLYKTSIIETGDLDLLRGNAAVYYHNYRNQFERKMIDEFKRHDVFHNEADTRGVAVHAQKDGLVYYYLYTVGEKKARFWQVPSTELKKMPIHKFALNILKMNSERYRDLIHPKMMIPGGKNG